ncbi:MAG: hypothetical protein N2691_05830 [Patescibacteria group bacterium]|nr:hypothetical protein [Patescibacteria group bacterium]
MKAPRDFCIALLTFALLFFFAFFAHPAREPACAQESCSLMEIYQSCGAGSSFGCISPTPTPVPDNPWIKVKTFSFHALNAETFKNFQIPQNAATRKKFNENDPDDENLPQFMLSDSTDPETRDQIPPGVVSAPEFGALNDETAVSSGWVVDGYTKQRSFSPRRFLDYANARKQVKRITNIRDEFEANRVNVFKPENGVLLVNESDFDNGADQFIIPSGPKRGGAVISSTITMTAEGSALNNSNTSGTVQLNGVVENNLFKGRFIGPGPGGEGKMFGTVKAVVTNATNGPVRGTCTYTGATVTNTTNLEGGVITPGCVLTGMNSFVLVVDGDLVITRDINHCRSPSYFANCAGYVPYPLAIVVTGTTTIRSSGDENNHVNTINAILITENLVIEPTNGRDLFGLKIKGNLSVFNRFQNDRRRYDSRRPVLFVVHNPSMYFSMLPYFSTADYAWKQIQ